MKIEVDKLTKAVENKRQQIMENKALEKRLLNELKTKFSILSFDEAKQIVKDAQKEIKIIRLQRDDSFVDFVERYSDKLGLTT